MRRLAHYDYWSDKVKRSVLLDSGADLLMYGMGEHSVLEIAQALDSGISVKDITYVRGTVFRCGSLEDLAGDYQMLPSYGEILASKEKYAQSFYQQYLNTDAVTAKRLVEPYKEKEYIVQNPPALPLTTQEMDQIYELPYERTWHPSYDSLGGVPAIEEVRFSLVSNRGCFGGCSFCALTFHQGRRIQVRSHESLLKEAELMTKDPKFKGYIHDVGGPTADFRKPSCQKQLEKGVCPKRQCLFPKPCPNLEADHRDYIALLRKLRKLPGVKKVFIRSGIRFDYVLADKSQSFLDELCRYHISGQLKVAPEHVSDTVLRQMGKPENAVYEAFRSAYIRKNKELGLKQYLVPYLMSSHPGSGLKEAVELAEYVRDLGYMPEQVQDYYPTPGTISTCIYYTGIHPESGEKVYVPDTPAEKRMQRALIQYRNPENYELVKKALQKAGRQDLIGFGPKCLIPPEKGKAFPGKKKDFPGKEKTSPEKGKKSLGKERSFSGKERKLEEGRREEGIKKNTRKKKTIRNVHKKKKNSK